MVNFILLALFFLDKVVVLKLTSFLSLLLEIAETVSMYLIKMAFKIHATSPWSMTIVCKIGSSLPDLYSLLVPRPCNLLTCSKFFLDRLLSQRGLGHLLHLIFRFFFFPLKKQKWFHFPQRRPHLDKNNMMEVSFRSLLNFLGTFFALTTAGLLNPCPTSPLLLAWA